MKIGPVETIVNSHCLDCNWNRDRDCSDTLDAIHHADTFGHRVEATITLKAVYDGRIAIKIPITTHRTNQTQEN